VLLDDEGNIALTDFGLSKEGINDNSSAHSFCGTPEYLAPEILRRSGHGRAADWWSLGALLYEMLTGIPPFYSRDRERLFTKILRATLRLPQHLSEDSKSLLTVSHFSYFCVYLLLFSGSIEQRSAKEAWKC
jgi:serum/glucocorticoid-regulated kinase 2